MAACQLQSSLNDMGAMISDPSGDAGLVPGPLQLRDRTIWWTGRVAIGLTHGGGDDAWPHGDKLDGGNPCAASACSEFLADDVGSPCAAAARGTGIARWMTAMRRALFRLAGLSGELPMAAPRRPGARGLLDGPHRGPHRGLQ